MAFSLAHNIHRRRLDAGFSQVRLAQLTGLSQTWISRLENGEENPSLETLKRLALAFGVGLTNLLEDSAA